MQPCPLDRLRSMGTGSVSAFTRVFDALWAGTTQESSAPRPPFSQADRL